MNENITIYALRYALGRSTYAVNQVADYIIDNVKDINVSYRIAMIKEINSAIIEGRAGFPEDVALWEKVRAALSDYEGITHER